MNNTDYNLKNERKVFSRIGFALGATVAVSFIAQLLFVIVPKLIWGENNWFSTSFWDFLDIKFCAHIFVCYFVGNAYYAKNTCAKARRAQIGNG